MIDRKRFGELECMHTNPRISVGLTRSFNNFSSLILLSVLPDVGAEQTDGTVS